MNAQEFVERYDVTMKATRRHPFPHPHDGGLLVGWDVTLTHHFTNPPVSFEALGYTTDVAVTTLALPNVLHELAGVAYIGGLPFSEAVEAADWEPSAESRRTWQLWNTERGRLHDWFRGTVGMWQDFLSLESNTTAH